VLHRPWRLDNADGLLSAETDATARCARRHGLSFCAELRFDDDRGQSQSFTATTLNISEAGCAVRLYGTVTAGVVATLWIAYGSAPIELPVRVVWTGSEVRGHVAGLAFDDLNGAQRLQIARLIGAETRTFGRRTY
jgi:hypothetical protein